MYEYIDDEVDLSILKFIKQQEKEFSAKENNQRDEFYQKLNCRFEIEKKLTKLLQPWLRLYEESLYLMWRLYKLYEKIPAPKSPFTLLIDLIKNINSVRILFLSGYSSMGLALYRRVFEEMQLELLIISSKEEAQKIMDENLEPTEYWKKHVGYGKLSKKLDEILQGIDEQYYAEFKEDPIGKKLSEFLHANTSAAIPIEPFIGNPDLFSFSPFGSYNYNSIHSMKTLVDKQIAFVGANISLILKDKTWFDLREYKGSPDELKSLLISINALSQCFDNYFACYEKEPDMLNNTIDDGSKSQKMVL